MEREAIVLVLFVGRTGKLDEPGRAARDISVARVMTLAQIAKNDPHKNRMNLKN